MLQELLSLNIFSFMLVFVRVGAAMSLFPGFSINFVNLQTRLMMAILVSLMMTPVMASVLPGMPETAPELFLLIAGEATVGFFLGVITRILIAALQTAGTFLAYFSALANAFIQDPLVEQQSSVFSSFLSITALLVIFVTDTHHLMLRALVDSYSLFQPGQPLPVGDFVDLLARRVMDSFKLGLQLSSPLLVTGISYYVGIGLISRLMPQLPVFFFGLPIQITMQITVLMLSLSTIMMVFMSSFEEGLMMFLVP